MYDFLFINSHRQIEMRLGPFCDWLGIYCLATFLDKNGYPSRAFSGYTHEVEKILEDGVANGVKCVGLSCDYENRQEVFQLCRHIRQKYGLPVVIGGPQSIGLDENYLRESGCLAIMHGEGELPWLGLAQYIADGYGHLRDISALTFIENGVAMSTLRGKPIKNLDNLPFIDPTLVLNRDFRKNTLTLLTARGCPFRCSFCFEGGNTRGVRWRGVDNVMAEIRQAFSEKPSLKYILFADDTFTLNQGRLCEFVAALREYRKERDFIWFAEAHPATIVKHPEIVREMVDAGLANMQIGLESGIREILEAYNKKTTPEMLRETVAICREAGVPHLTANIIVGGAHETGETLVKSREFALELLEIGPGMMEINPVFFWPLPNTAMTTRPEFFGMEILDPDSLTSSTDYPVVRCGELTPHELTAALQTFKAAMGEKRAELIPTLEPEWIKKVMALAWRYPFTSCWVEDLVKIDRFRRYTALYDSGAIRESWKIPQDELPYWHPQRMCPPIVKNGCFYADDLEIPEDVFEVLKISSGRLGLADAAERVGLAIGEFMEKAEFLERNLALGFCRY